MRHNQGAGWPLVQSKAVPRTIAAAPRSASSSTARVARSSSSCAGLGAKFYMPYHYRINCPTPRCGAWPASATVATHSNSTPKISLRKLPEPTSRDEAPTPCPKSSLNERNRPRTLLAKTEGVVRRGDPLDAAATPSPAPLPLVPGTSEPLIVVFPHEGSSRFDRLPKGNLADSRCRSSTRGRRGRSRVKTTGIAHRQCPCLMSWLGSAHREHSGAERRER